MLDDVKMLRDTPGLQSAATREELPGLLPPIPDRIRFHTRARRTVFHLGERGGWAIVERFDFVGVTKARCTNDAVFDGIRGRGLYDAEGWRGSVLAESGLMLALRLSG